MCFWSDISSLFRFFKYNLTYVYVFAFVCMTHVCGCLQSPEDILGLENTGGGEQPEVGTRN